MKIFSNIKNKKVNKEIFKFITYHRLRKYVTLIGTKERPVYFAPYLTSEGYRVWYQSSSKGYNIYQATPNGCELIGRVPASIKLLIAYLDSHCRYVKEIFS